MYLMITLVPIEFSVFDIYHIYTRNQNYFVFNGFNDGKNSKNSTFDLFQNFLYEIIILYSVVSITYLNTNTSKSLSVENLCQNYLRLRFVEFEELGRV